MSTVLPLRPPSAAEVFNSLELVVFVALQAGLATTTRFACASARVAEACRDDGLWSQLLLSRLPQTLRGSVRCATDALAEGRGLPYRCWPMMLPSQQSPAPQPPSWFRAFQDGPAFVLGTCSPHALICEFGLGLYVLGEELSKQRQAGVYAYGNIRASSGLLYWEIWIERLAPSPGRRSGGAPPAAWLGIVQEHGQPLVSAETACGICLFSGGTFLRQNVPNAGGVGRPFGEGDAVGILADCDSRELEFFLNGNALGVAFRDIPLPVMPAVQIDDGQACQLRIGRPWRPSRAETMWARSVYRSSVATALDDSPSARVAPTIE